MDCKNVHSINNVKYWLSYLHSDCRILSYLHSDCRILSYLSQVQNMPPNTDHAHNKHMWTILCNFNQVQANTPWWWILGDPKHVGVIFNVYFLDFYTTQILSSKTVSIECINWLLKVLIIMMYVGDMKLGWEILVLIIYIYITRLASKKYSHHQTKYIGK